MALTPEQQQLVIDALPKMRAFVKNYARKLPGPSAEECESIACIGLVKAAITFDASNHTAFWTYAKEKVKYALADEWRAQDPLKRGKRGKVKALIKEWGLAKKEGLLGEDLTIESFVAQKKLEPDVELQMIHEMHRLLTSGKVQPHTVSMNDRFGESDRVTFESLIRDTGKTPEDRAIRRDDVANNRRMLQAGIKDCSPKVRTFLKHRLVDRIGENAVVAKRMGITPGRVSQLQKEAVETLSKHIHFERFKGEHAKRDENKGNDHGR
jgi:RNA polymerase sigma factor (sigma-70 family)